MNIDHKNPIANGGSNTKRNLQVLCRTCNPQSMANAGLILPATLALHTWACPNWLTGTWTWADALVRSQSPATR